MPGSDSAEETVDNGPIVTEEPEGKKKSFIARSDATVILLSDKRHDGKVVVKNDNGQFYLVPVESVTNTFEPQEISSSLLSEKPYDWSDEIAAITVTKNEIREALYREGFVSNEGQSLKKILASLIQRGKFITTR